MKGAALFMNERRIVQTGIDVSRHQGKIDWARVKAGGTGFAIIKCTQGVNTVDPEFHRNMRNCAAVGLPVGAYVYRTARTAFAAAEEAERPQPASSVAVMAPARPRAISFFMMRFPPCWVFLPW